MKHLITATLIATAPLMTANITNLSETMEWNTQSEFSYSWTERTEENTPAIGHYVEYLTYLTQTNEGDGSYHIKARALQRRTREITNHFTLTTYDLIFVYQVEALSVATQFEISQTIEKEDTEQNRMIEIWQGEITSDQFAQWYTYSYINNEGQAPVQPENFWDWDEAITGDITTTYDLEIQESISYAETKYYGVIITNIDEKLYPNDYSSITMSFVDREEQPTDIAGLLWEILGMPFAFVSSAFNFTFFAGTPYAINIANVLLSVVSALLLIFIIRKLTH